MRKGVYRDRIIFNGHDLSELVMCRPHRPIMPPTTLSTESVGGRHGEHFRRVSMDGYDVPVEIWIRANDRRSVAELRHELAALLWTDEPAPLHLPDDPTRYYLAIVDGSTDLGQITNELPGCTINFHVCDPIAYGAECSTELASGTEKALYVGGTYEARPVITSTLAGGTWRLENVGTAEFVEVNATTFGASLAAGSTLVCDMATEQLTINGNTAGVTVNSDFFGLLGESVVEVTGADFTEARWLERWL